MDVYGCRISYYTGKFETYLRYRSKPYTMLPTVGNEAKLIQGAGAVQMPVVQLDDGRWMTDSTPMIAWFEAQQTTHSIYPEDPVTRFVALLIEDYADEWLWRPAMHYRWSFRLSRNYAAEILYEELIKGVLPMPRPVALNRLKTRQRGGFVKGDGVTKNTRSHVEGTYHKALELMQSLLSHHPFMLGETPTIADFALMGPMFRHFSQDPTPAEIMRNQAPCVYEWVARMWNVKPATKPADAPCSLEGLKDILAEISETHLAALRQNAVAFTCKKGRHDSLIQDCQYKDIPTSRYRVWCLEELRREWQALGSTNQDLLRTYLPESAAILWDSASFKTSNYDEGRLVPFNKAINVFGDGVPPR